jgi:hypothetical protein
MRITLTIPDKLAAQARAHGASVEAYVLGLIEQARPKSPHAHNPRTPEQIERFFAAMSEGSQKLPLLPAESFTRESCYGDRV